MKAFAREHGLEYAEFKFIEGNAEVLGVLKDVAQQVKFVTTVADHEAKERLFGPNHGNVSEKHAVQ